MPLHNNDLRHLANYENALLIPAAQAIAVGLSTGLTLTFLGTAWGWSDAMEIGGAAACLTVTGAFLHFRGEWSKRMNSLAGIQPVEVIQHATTYPQETVSIVKLSIDWDEGRAGLFDDIRIDDETFIAWACGAAQGKSLGENWWTGSHGLFSKGQYHHFISKMIHLGMIRQRGRTYNQGYELTGKGRAVMAEIDRRYGGNVKSPSPTGLSLRPRDKNRA